jgi:non-lysosomal glucosylceramidase
MSNSGKQFSRRALLTTATGAAFVAGAETAGRAAGAPEQKQPQRHASKQISEYPRKFEGNHLRTISFPLGGIAAGSIGLGGRGDLRDWEIFNKPGKGKSPEYGFMSIWAQAEGSQPVARVLEGKLIPPFEAGGGMGPANVPGLLRLENAAFEGEFPFARVRLSDPELPVRVTLEAFSPFFPLDAEESGLPVAILRYRVENPGSVAAETSLCFSLSNPVGDARIHPEHHVPADGKKIEFREDNRIKALEFSNESLPQDDPLAGSFVVGVLDPDSHGGKLSHLRGWPLVKWWTSPLLFWDDFKKDGEVGPEWEKRRPIGSLCLKKRIAPGAAGDFTFLFAWRFPNRTPEWCGWTAPKGDEKVNLGNHYAVRFSSAWEAAQYAAANIERLEKKTREFALAVRESTLPPVVKDAAMSNLSTLVTQTCFRTADGEFHGFEGINDNLGCCFGNCTHVWNYETATSLLFPSLARSLRKHSFGYSQDEQGGMRFRQLLPDGKQRFGFAAADGQMGQILHAYLDFQQSGDIQWLRGLWPQIKHAVEYCWIPGGWDANRDGVFEGVQHNTYDVEFYGPNPLGCVYYLGGLRAAEAMARILGDEPAASDYRRLFESGSRWIDANLFNGDYYIQKIRGIPKNEIAASTVGDMGAEDTLKPQFQLGDGCLVDQLMGQYLADLAGLGDLLKSENLRKTLDSIYRYNYKPTLAHHESVQRIYALENEAATVVCDYGHGERPEVPFPYFAEAWTGLEYTVASLLISRGMTQQGITCVEAVRARYDGERRDPWDEFECGHHYARAMSSWSLIPALSGFRYDGAKRQITASPRINRPTFNSLWSTADAWGVFSLQRGTPGPHFSLEVKAGKLRCAALTLPDLFDKASIRQNRTVLEHSVKRQKNETVLSLSSEAALQEGDRLDVRS